MFPQQLATLTHYDAHGGMRVMGAAGGRGGVRVLELGSWEGLSACWLLTHVRTCSLLTCVDSFEGRQDRFPSPPSEFYAIHYFRYALVQYLPA